MRYVWTRRLEKTQQDLSNPALMGVAVSDIAMKWGFNDLSQFSRAFKLKFGASPRAWRAQALLAKSMLDHKKSGAQAAAF